MTPEERRASAQHASARFQQQMAEATPEERRANMDAAIRSNIKYGPEIRAQIIADYASGLGFLRVAKLHGIATGSVRSILKQEGIASRTFSPVEHAHQSAQRKLDDGRGEAPVRNSHGLAGVSRTRSGQWTSRAKIKGKFVRTGVWPTKEAAHAAYLALKSY